MSAYEKAKKEAIKSLGKGASEIDILRETALLLKKKGKLKEPKSTPSKKKKKAKISRILGGEVHRINEKFASNPSEKERIRKAYFKNVK